MDFPKDGFFKILEPGVEILCGGFLVSDITELAYVRASILNQGTVTGSLQLNVYSSNDLTTKIATSDWSALSEIEDFNSGNWYGRLRFIFPTPLNLNPNHEIFITMNNKDYIRNLDVDYLGLKYDWPLPQNTQPSPNVAGMMLEFFGNE